MDETIVYPTAEILAEDVLNTNRRTLIALGALIQMVLGQNGIVDGFVATPGTTGLSVVVAGGSISYLGVVDATAYGVLAANANPLMRQAIVLPPTTLTVPAVGTWLISVAPVQSDGDNTVLPFVNAANTSIPFSGPGGNGGLLPTVRQDRAVLAITSGTGVPAGSTPLYVVTVPAGATSVTAADIATAPGAPFIAKLPFLAPLASPQFTGSPTAPTPAAGDDSSLIATTAFVDGVVATETAARIAALTAETDAREAEDSSLQSQITAEIANREAADTAVENWAAATFTTPAAVSAALSAAEAYTQASMLGGSSQNWTNYTGARALNSVYTNSTAAPIFVYASVNGNGDVTLGYLIDGQGASQAWAVGDNEIQQIGSVNFVVPPGGTYEVTTGIGTLLDWFELR